MPTVTEEVNMTMNIKVNLKLYASKHDCVSNPQNPIATFGDRYICGYGDTVPKALLSYGHVLETEGYTTSIHTTETPKDKTMRTMLMAENSHECLVYEVC